MISALSQNRRRLFSLSALVIGSMIGAGNFPIPQTFAVQMDPPGSNMTWLMAMAGMCALARVFQALAERKPDPDAGVPSLCASGFRRMSGRSVG